MHQFFNAPESVVDEMLTAVTELSSVSLSVPSSGARVVVRDDARVRREHVAILSGGGAGHEPAHAGFVGEGMLTGAISGDVFASPTTDAVLAAIRHVSGPAGCLLVVKNYTGDRLNFGLARERALEEGIEVGLVVVADDLALGKTAHARGVAGTVLVHKLAGYLSANGRPLREIEHECQKLAGELVSVGMALSSSLVPGKPPERRSAELGLGIHNEPGARKVSPKNAHEAMQLVLEPLLSHFDRTHGPNAKMVVLLNDLGGCSPQEMLVLAHALLSGIGVERVALMVRPAALMTSLDMRGFSVTLAPATELLVEALSAQTEAVAWPGVVRPRPPRTFAIAMGDLPTEARTIVANAHVSSLVRAMAHGLLAAEADLDALDALVGDGDTGKTFATAARSVLAALDAGALSTGEPRALAHELGALLSRSMGGSSGALLAIFFSAAASALAKKDSLTEAFGHGLERMTTYGGAKPGDRTMLDALVPAIDALGGGVSAAAKAAREGANATAHLAARAGRSAYVPAGTLVGVVDPGAEAVARALEAAAKALSTA